jgi:Ca2+-binding RTX toxin-like protein
MTRKLIHSLFKLTPLTLAMGLTVSVSAFSQDMVTPITVIEAPTVDPIEIQKEAKRLSQLQRSDFGFLLDSGSADHSAYYSNSVYLATHIAGKFGASSSMTWSAYYTMEWIGYIISESLYRAGHDDVAAYFPHSQRFDVQIDAGKLPEMSSDWYAKDDGGEKFGLMVAYGLDQMTDGGSTVAAEVVADATASMAMEIAYSYMEKGKAIQNFMQITANTGKYVAQEDIVTSLGEIMGVQQLPGLEQYYNQQASTNNNLPPYQSIPQSDHSYSQFNTLLVAVPQSNVISSGSTFNVQNANAAFMDFPNIRQLAPFASYFINSGQATGNSEDDIFLTVDLAGGGGGNDLFNDVKEAFGGDGDDHFQNGGIAYGNNGDDTFYQIDEAYGGNGKDTFMATSIAYGNGGTDSFQGSTASEAFYGGDGRDMLIGGGGTDTLHGGAGDDVIQQIIKAGANSLNNDIDGGQGFDSLHISFTAKVSNVPLEATMQSFDTLKLYRGASDSLSIKNIEEIAIEDFSSWPSTLLLQLSTLAIHYYGSDSSNWVEGGRNGDLIRGEGGDDTLYGRGGSDQLDGGAGDDLLYGEDGDDILYPGSGANTLDGGADSDTVALSSLTESASWDMNSSELITESGEISQLSNIENVIGSPYNDHFIGDAGNNLLIGEAGNDILEGGAGDDHLITGQGHDTLTGGTGADIFEVTTNTGNVIISDFSFSQGDKLVLDVYALGIPLDDAGNPIFKSTTMGGRYHVLSRLNGTDAVILITYPSGIQRSVSLQGVPFNDFTTTNIEWVNRDPALIEVSETILPLQTLSLNAVDENWQNTDLSQNIFKAPAVFHSAPTINGTDGGVLRLKNIQAASFETAFREWDHHNGAHTLETVDFLALEPGHYVMQDGTTIEVGTFTLSNNHDFNTLTFGKTFSSSPSVFLSVQSFNGSSSVSTRVKNITTEGFDAGLFEIDSLKYTGHNTEMVAYVAILPTLSNGYGNLDTYSGSQTYRIYKDSLDHNSKQIGEFNYMIQEDNSVDSETDHTMEDVILLEIGGITLIQQVSHYGEDNTTIRKLP